MSQRFTIIGSRGFIGSALSRHMKMSGEAVLDISREELDALEGDVGHVIYAIGLTSDFRSRPLETVEAHVGVLSRLFRRINFESFLYLSSTRIYASADQTTEHTTLLVKPENPDHLYNLSKLMGEAICLADIRQSCRVVRLSNVVGAEDRSDNFLTSVLNEAATLGKVKFQTARGSARDFISIDDVCRVLPRIAMSGRERIYNVASGKNVSNAEVGDALERIAGIKCFYDVSAPTVAYPLIDVGRVRDEFGFRAVPFDQVLGQILSSKQLSSKV